MSFEIAIVAAIIGAAVGWLVRRAIVSARRRKDGGCAGHCGCGDKLKKR